MKIKDKKPLIAVLVGSKISENQIAIFNNLNMLLSKDYDLHLVVARVYRDQFTTNGKVHAYKTICKFGITSAIIDAYNYLAYTAHIRPQLLYHICTPKRMGLIVALTGKFLGIPSVVTMSGEALYSHRYRKGIRQFTSFVGTYFSKCAFRLASKIVCIGKNLETQLLNNGFPASKIDVIPQPIDLARFYPPADKYKYKDIIKVPQNKTIVLFVGRLTKIKGADKLYSIVSKLMNTSDEHVFILVGDGPYKKSFNLLSTEKVKCVGNIPHNDIDSYYKAADVTVFTSMTEGCWPNVVLESLACAVPVVSSNVGDVADIVSNICTSVDDYTDYLQRKNYKLDQLPDICSKNNMKKRYTEFFNSCIYAQRSK